jgi:DNA-binding CsgD family transcriptional regulator
VLRGQLPVAREHLRRMNKLRADGITCAPEDVFWPIACVQFADGQPAAAVTALHDLYRWLPDRMLLFSYDAGIVVGMVRIALAAGDPVRARVTAEAAALLAQRNPSVSSLGAVAAHADGLVRRDIAALRRAVDLFRDSPRPLARVSALEDTAKAEQNAGHRDRAIQLLHQAIEEATRCGALGAVQRMTKQLLRLGVQAEAEPQSDRGPVSPLAGLTAMELNIAQLVANGLTNAQIAERFNRSPHTIDSHLRKIFAKLGVNSRIALTRIVLENDQPG